MINAVKYLKKVSQGGPIFIPLLRDNVVHKNLSKINIEISKIFYENMDRFDYTLVSYKPYLDEAKYLLGANFLMSVLSWFYE